MTTKERPILFSCQMVRALLDGTKTQTRRIIKPQPHADPKFAGGFAVHQPKRTMKFPQIAAEVSVEAPYVHDCCPYGQPGDRLWVRETFMDLDGTGVEHRDASGRRQRYAYAAEFPPESYGDGARKDYGLKWKPSIHMPRAASRILLEIVSVRVERLQDISEPDARAEGITDGGCVNCGEPEPKCKCDFPMPDARDAYCHLWESINGAGSWATNPWVWCVTFRRIK